jgi:hypothetical protein
VRVTERHLASTPVCLQFALPTVKTVGSEILGEVCLDGEGLGSASIQC